MNNKSLARALTSPWSLYLVMSVLGTALAIHYVSNERMIYFWDYNGFAGITEQFAIAMMSSFAEGWQIFAASFHTEYNLLFAIPLLPIISFAPDSRILFITAIAGLFYPAYCVAAGRLCEVAFPQFGRISLWLGAFLAAIMPTVWGVTARGYPDTIASAFFFTGIVFFLRDFRLEKWSTIFAVGFFMAAATIIRRHVLFADLGLLFTVGIVILIDTAQRLNDGRLTLWSKQSFLRLSKPALVLLSFLAFLTLMGPLFVKSLVMNDYGSLYASYQRSAWYLINLFFWKVQGPVLLSIGLLGCVAGILMGFRKLDARLVLCLYCLMWLCSWLFVSKQQGHHQMIVGLPLIPLVGMFTLFSLMFDRGLRRISYTFILLMTGFAGLNAFLVYGVNQQRFEDANVQWGVFSHYYGPMRRTDFDSIRSLIDHARQHAQPTLVAASSVELNFDIIVQAEKQFFSADNRKLAVIYSSQVDSRDPLSVEDYLRAGQIIGATPFQSHVGADQQQVVESVLDRVLSGDPAFRIMPERFPIGKGGEAFIATRVRPTTLDEAMEMTTAMKATVPALNARFQDYWYQHDYAHPAGMNWNADGSRNIYATVPSTGVRFSLLRRIDNARLKGNIRVSGCSGVNLTIGDTTVDFAGGVSPIDLDITTAGILEMAIVPLKEPCSVDLTDLRVVD